MNAGSVALFVIPLQPSVEVWEPEFLSMKMAVS